MVSLFDLLEQLLDLCQQERYKEVNDLRDKIVELFG